MTRVGPAKAMVALEYMSKTQKKELYKQLKKEKEKEDEERREPRKDRAMSTDVPSHRTDRENTTY